MYKLIILFLLSFSCAKQKNPNTSDLVYLSESVNGVSCQSCLILEFNSDQRAMTVTFASIPPNVIDIQGCSGSVTYSAVNSTPIILPSNGDSDTYTIQRQSGTTTACLPANPPDITFISQANDYFEFIFNNNNYIIKRN